MKNKKLLFGIWTGLAMGGLAFAASVSQSAPGSGGSESSAQTSGGGGGSPTTAPGSPTTAPGSTAGPGLDLRGGGNSGGTSIAPSGSGNPIRNDGRQSGSARVSGTVDSIDLAGNRIWVRDDAGNVNQYRISNGTSFTSNNQNVRPDEIKPGDVIDFQQTNPGNNPDQRPEPDTGGMR